MIRSQLHPMPVYFDRYITMTDDVEIIKAIQTSIDELDIIPLDIWKQLGTAVYAPGKWAIHDILQHVIDTERIFMYRALAFSRNEKQPMPSFSEDEYATVASGTSRTIESLLEELRIVHLCFKAMFESFTPAMLVKNGVGFKGEYSVASIGFMMPGHQRWHFKMIEEKYYPLISVSGVKL